MREMSDAAAAVRERVHQRDVAYREAKEAEEAKAAKERAEALQAERREAAQAEIEAELERLHQQFLDHDGDEASWPAFKAVRRNEMVGARAEVEDRAAYQTFLGYVRGRGF